MPSQLLRDFRSQVRSRFAEDSDAMPMTEWITKNTKLKKKPFAFTGYEFQQAIVDDMHPRMSVIKCSQIGLTEVQLRKFAGFLTRNTAVNAIFTLPDDAMYKRVSQTRFKPMIETERVFNLGGGDKPIRSMALYQINQSFGYFTGNKEGDATSINADLLFHDELDLSDQEMIALFQSRLQGSDYRITQSFSTPTFEGFGIDAGFKGSDQHEYMTRCCHCGHHNIPEFTPDFIHVPGLTGDLNDLTEVDDDMLAGLDLSAACVLCEQCHNPLDLGDPTLRTWVPRHPGRRDRGYRVTPFCTPRLTVEYIFDQLLGYKKKDALRRFYNTVLGKAYNDSNARLSDIEIMAVMNGGAKVEYKGKIMVGIDQGITCHMVLMNENGVVFEWRQVLADNLYNEVERLMVDYEIVGGCIDRNPYTPLANDIRDLTNGMIVPVEYAGQPGAAAVQIVNDELDQLSHIRANRTSMIDTVVGKIRKRKTAFAGYGQYEALIRQHLRDMVRIEKEDTSAVWQKLTGNDHFFHALAYVFFATRVFDAIRYRSDEEEREMITTNNLIITMKGGADMGLRHQRKHTTSLGMTS